MSDNDAYVAQLRQRLAALEARIAELSPHSARDAERRALEARVSYILHKLNAPNAYHGPAWAHRLTWPTNAATAADS